MTASDAPKPYTAIPVVDFPANYAEVLPTFLARAAQEKGPIFRRRLYNNQPSMFGEAVVYMVGPDANRFVMHTHRDAFSHDQGWTPLLGGTFEKGLLNTDEPEHARERKMMNPAFAVAYMSKYLPIMNRIIATRTADWVERGTIDLYDEARKITFDVAAEALVGIPTGPQVDRLRVLFYALIRGELPEQPEDEAAFYHAYQAAQDELNSILLEMIAQRRRTPTDDILGLLVSARDDDGAAFTDRQLLGQLHILLVAGHETSTTLTSWLLYLLAVQPEYLARVREEMESVLATTGGAITLDALKALPVLTNALSEAGRLYSPVGNVPRGTTKDFDFAGYHVPAGTRVMLSLGGGHRLPQYFADPERFDPDRFAAPRDEEKRTPYALVPFGGGPRICIGINFAQIEIKALAVAVLRSVNLAPAMTEAPRNIYYAVTASLDAMPMYVSAR